jgi:hypothetical protein
MEIKSGQTITSSYFRGLQKFRELFPDLADVPDFLIYSGETEQVRRETKVMRIFSLAGQLEEIG